MDVQGLCTIRYALKISTSGINSEIPLRRTKVFVAVLGSGIGCGSGCRAEAEGRQDLGFQCIPDEKLR